MSYILYLNDLCNSNTFFFLLNSIHITGQEVNLGGQEVNPGDHHHPQGRVTVVPVLRHVTVAAHVTDHLRGLGDGRGHVQDGGRQGPGRAIGDCGACHPDM